MHSAAPVGFPLSPTLLGGSVLPGEVHRTRSRCTAPHCLGNTAGSAARLVCRHSQHGDSSLTARLINIANSILTREPQHSISSEPTTSIGSPGSNFGPNPFPHFCELRSQSLFLASHHQCWSFFTKIQLPKFFTGICLLRRVIMTVN